MPPTLGLADPSRTGSTRGTPKAPTARLSRADVKALGESVAETRSDAALAFRTSNAYTPPPKRGPDGVFRTAGGDPVVMLQLRGPGREPLGNGGMRAFISPNTNQVYISQLGGFAGETTKGPFNLESTNFPKDDYSAAEIQSMQERAGGLDVERAPNRNVPAPTPRRPSPRDFDSGDFDSGEVFRDINRRAGGNI